MREIGQGLVYFAVRMSVCVVQAMPIETCHSVSRWLAWVACDVARIRRDTVEENIGRSFPQLSEAHRHRLARRMWENLFLMVCEIAHAPRKIHRTNWRKYFDIPQARTIVRTLINSRPTLMVSAHYGNFELAGFLAGLLGFPSFTIARPLDNRHLDGFINRFRGLNGQFILPKKGSAPQVQWVLEQGGLLALLADQHAGPKGCWIEFLGRLASYHKALAVFSLTGDAPMMVVYARRTRRPMHFVLGTAGLVDPAELPPEQANVKSLTEWYSRLLEQIIIEDAEQYWWLHRRWRDPPPPRKKKKKRPRQAA